MELHEVIGDALAHHGVDTIFGIIGDANLFFVNSFVARGLGGYVNSSNEQGAVLMAAGYASVSGRLGVATATHGAITNTITALGDTTRSRTPVLLIAGDTAATDKFNPQNLPHRDLVLPTGAGFEQVRAPETLVEDMASAMRRAYLERRPIVLNTPADFQWAEMDFDPAPLDALVRGQTGGQAMAPDPAVLDRAVGMLAAAQRPFVLCGRGVAAPAARAAALGLAERLGAPVGTTLKAKDLFRGEPYDLGIVGTLGSHATLEAVGASDCVVVLGAALHPYTTDKGSLLEGKTVVQCDIDPGRIGAYHPVTCGIVADAGVTASTISAWLDEADVKPSRFRESVAAVPSAPDPVPYVTDPPAGTVDIREALYALEAAMPEDRTLTADGGRFFVETAKIISVPEPSAYIHTLDMGSIGLGMGKAVGAAHGTPHRPVLLVAGDGGFMLGGLAEFNTAVRSRADVIVVLLNDRAYGAEHIQFRNRDLDPALSIFDWPDFAAVADALGGRGHTVTSRADLAELPTWIAERDRPLLIDIHLDPDGIPPP